jgi:peptidoglycan/LPS O-acetylase OafA/YrhL
MDPSNNLACFLCIIRFDFDDRFAIHYAPLFGLGIVCYWYLTGKEKGRETLLFALSMLVFAALRFELRMTSSMIPAALCIVYLRYDKPWSNRFGDISYSLYLTHSSLGGHVLALAAVGCQHGLAQIPHHRSHRRRSAYRCLLLLEMDRKAEYRDVEEDTVVRGEL